MEKNQLQLKNTPWYLRHELQEPPYQYLSLWALSSPRMTLSTKHSKSVLERGTLLYCWNFRLWLCLHDSRVEICRVFTRGGLESSAKNSTSRFPTTRTIFWKRILQSTRRIFSTRFELFTCIFSSFYKPGCKRAIGFMCVPGWNSSCKTQPMFTWQPGWDLSCVYKRRVGIKREE